jgi:isoleucyl-tRNA synthetase
VTVTKLLAPFLPFLAEELYQNLVRSVDATAPESVHHCEYPAPSADLEDETIVEQMDRVRLLASLGHAVRKQVAIPVRRPLPAVRVAGDASLQLLPRPLLDELATELNVKRVEFPENLTEAVQPRVETNPRLLGPKYGKAYPRLRAALQARAFERTEDGKLRVDLDGESVILEPDEASVTLEPAPGYAAAVGDGVLVVLDTEQSPELIAEGRARELVRLIQDARKAAGFLIADRIVVGLDLPGELRDTLQTQLPYVKQETLATTVEALPAPTPTPDGDRWSHRAEDEIDGLPVVVAVRKSVS